MKTITIIRDGIIKYAIPCTDDGELVQNEVATLPRWVRLKAGDRVCIVEW